MAELTPPRLISLSDSQFQQVMTACEILQPVDRSTFLFALAQRLCGKEIGDGTVPCAIRELLVGEFFKPPVITNPQPRSESKLKAQKPIGLVPRW
jgi:hypothetical protein